ncbi:MAG: hypothetical protein PHY80_01155 [Rickettsiales bacterium]|nr:hypothetical protein [Rickettsiales bacterium]
MAEVVEKTNAERLREIEERRAVKKIEIILTDSTARDLFKADFSREPMLLLLSNQNVLKKILTFIEQNPNLIRLNTFLKKFNAEQIQEGFLAIREFQLKMILMALLKSSTKEELEQEHLGSLKDIIPSNQLEELKLEEKVLEELFTGKTIEEEKELETTVLSEIEDENLRKIIERHEKFVRNLEEKIDKQQIIFQGKYEKSKTVEEALQIQQEWQEYLASVMKVFNSTNEGIIELLNEEIERRPLSFDRDYKEKPHEEVERSLIRLKAAIDNLEQLSKEIVGTFKTKGRDFAQFIREKTLKDKGDRLVAAGADIPQLHETGISEQPQNPEITLPKPTQATSQETPVLALNAIVAVVAFAFGNINTNSKFSVSCSINEGFSTGLPNKLDDNIDFQSVIRLSQIFVAAGIKNVIKNADGSFTFDVVNGEKKTETAVNFIERIQKIMQIMYPEPKEPITNGNEVVKFFNTEERENQCFENIRQSIFEKTTGCQSYVVNEVRQLPGGLIEKRLTTDGDPRLPGCGSHSVVTSNRPKIAIATITNWINSNEKDVIKCGESEEINLTEKDIKKHPFELELVHNRRNGKAPEKVYVLRTDGSKTKGELQSKIGKIEKVENIKAAEKIDEDKRKSQNINLMTSKDEIEAKEVDRPPVVGNVRGPLNQYNAGEYYEDCTGAVERNPQSLIRQYKEETDKKEKRTPSEKPIFTLKSQERKILGQLKINRAQ